MKLRRVDAVISADLVPFHSVSKFEASEPIGRFFVRSASFEVPLSCEESAFGPVGPFGDEMLSKAQLRQAFRSNLERLQEPAAFATSSARVVHQLAEFFKDQSGMWAAFQPIGFEPDIRDLFKRVAHIQWVFPRVEGDYLSFYRVNDTSELIHNQWRIPEPDPSRGHEAMDLATCAGVLVPGLAFDTSGRRLGRGKGYYDRALSKVTQGRLADVTQGREAAVKPSDIQNQQATKQLLKVGVAFDKQISSMDLPTEPHDIAMDWLVTESRCVNVSGETAAASPSKIQKGFSS